MAKFNNAKPQLFLHQSNTHTHTMEYSSVTKKNEIISFVVTWLDLKIIVQSEVDQTKKDKYMILLTRGI